MQKTGILTAAFFMLTAVALGAFGAHGLKAILSETSLEVFKTGVFYQFVHALGIFIAAILSKLFDLQKLKTSIIFFTIGILFFSGSLYLLSTREVTGLAVSFLGPITPIGGLFFMLGWGFMALETWRSKKI